MWRLVSDLVSHKPLTKFFTDLYVIFLSNYSATSKYFKRCFESFFAHYSALTISSDMKHIVVFFFDVIMKWCHPKMVTPGRPPRPPPLSDATAGYAPLTNIRKWLRLIFATIYFVRSFLFLTNYF